MTGAVTELELVPGFAASGELYFGTSRGELLRSDDFGETFVRVGAGLPGEMITALAASPEYPVDGTLFAATARHAIFESTDRGTTWTHRDVGVPPTAQADIHFHVVALSDAFATDRRLFVAAFEGLLASWDGGASWSELELVPPSGPTAVAVSPHLSSDPTLALATYGGGIYVSSDAGATWQVANLGIHYPTVWDTEFADGGALGPILFAAPIGGVATTDAPGAPWDLDPLPDPAFPRQLAVSPAVATDGTLLVATGHEELGVLISRDRGETWETTLTPEDPGASLALSPLFDVDGVGFVGTSTGRVHRTRDAGQSWEQVGEGQLPEKGRAVWLAISPEFGTDGEVFAGTVGGLWLSEDQGDAWAPATAQPPLSDGPIAAVAVSPGWAADGTVLASVRGSGLYLSEDGGGSWTSVGGELLDAGHQVHGLTFSPEFAADGAIFGVSGAAALRSLDRGQSWRDLPLFRVRYEDRRYTDTWHAVRFAGSWTRLDSPGASSGRYRGTAERGADVWLDFVGPEITWVGAKGPEFGIAEVWIDDELAATVDGYSPTWEQSAPLFRGQELGAGSHRVRVVATGEKNPFSGGVTVIFDAFDVGR